MSLAGVPAQMQNITQMLQQQQLTLQQIQADLQQIRTEGLARQWTTARAFNGAAGNLHALLPLEFPPGSPAPHPPFPDTRTAVNALTGPQMTALLAAYAQPPVAQEQARRNALKVFIGLA